MHLLPDVPTMAEAGIADFVLFSWNGVHASAGTPPDIVAKLSAAVQEAYRKPQMQKEFADRGVEAIASTPEQLADLMKRDTELWGQVVKAGKVSLN